MAEFRVEFNVDSSGYVWFRAEDKNHAIQLLSDYQEGHIHELPAQQSKEYGSGIVFAPDTLKEVS